MKGLLLAVGYSASWGVGVTLSKLGLRFFEPVDLLMLELSASVAFLVVALLAGQGLGGLRRVSLKHGVAGILEPGLAYLFGTLGLALTTAVSASLIGTSEVVVTILAAVIVLRERVSPLRLTLAIVGTLGVVLIASSDGLALGTGGGLGDLLVFISVLCAVGYTLVSAPMVHKVGPLALVTSQQIVGILVLVPIWIVFSGGTPFAALRQVRTAGPWLIAIVSGLSQYAISYYLYLLALRSMDVNRATLFLILIPVFAAISAVIILGETIGPLQAAGGVVVLATAYFASREPNKRRAAAADR